MAEAGPDVGRAAEQPLADFKQVQPRVFAGLFPISSDDYEDCREALKKLKLNESLTLQL